MNLTAISGPQASGIQMIWRRLMVIFWAVLYKLLVGKCLPKLSSKSPPCTLEESAEARPAASHMCIPVQGALEGSNVLITGACGYVGSLVLEQVLRLCPGVNKVYVIIRSRKGTSGHTRIQHLLLRPLFHLLRSQHDNFDQWVNSKLVVLHGDLELPKCGLTHSDFQLLCTEVNFIIHSAANTSFTEPLPSLLRNNYWATSHLADIAQQAEVLRCFTYISTAYVSSPQQRGSHVEEQMYPLGYMDGKPLEHGAIARSFDSLEPVAAAALAEKYIKATAHTNAYTFSKHVTEHLIMDLHLAGLPVTIVRPAIVGCVAYSPCPGYFGNTIAGMTAVMLAYATGVGTFTCHNPTTIFDVIPGDFCAATILAASAALAQGRHQGTGPLIVHSASSTTHPCHFEKLFQEYVYPFWKTRRRLAPTLHKFNKPAFNVWRYPLAEDTLLFKMWTTAKTVKFWVLSCLLQLFGQKKLALRLWSGWKAFMLYNTEKLDFQLFFCSRKSCWLQRSLSPADLRAGMRCVWDARRDDWGYFSDVFSAAIYECYFKGPPVLGLMPVLGSAVEADALQVAGNTSRMQVGLSVGVGSNSTHNGSPDPSSAPSLQLSEESSCDLDSASASSTEECTCSAQKQAC